MDQAYDIPAAAKPSECADCGAALKPPYCEHIRAGIHRRRARPGRVVQPRQPRPQAVQRPARRRCPMTTPTTTPSPQIPAASYYLGAAASEITAAQVAMKVFYDRFLDSDPAAAGQRAITAMTDAIRTLTDARDMLARDIAKAAVGDLMPPPLPAPAVEEQQPTGDPLVDEAIANLRGSVLGGSLTRRRAAELAADWPTETREQLTDEQFERVLAAFPTEARIGGVR